VKVRRWHLDNYDADGEWVAALPFAKIDPTLDHMMTPARSLIERWSASCLALAEAVDAARKTVREARALVALSRGKPYLISCQGEQVITDRKSGRR
jgi:hypothetical protein